VQNEIILFDGNCNFCTGWVLWVIRRDKKKRYKFSASELPAAQELLKKFNNKSTDESVVLVAGDHIYQKSDAALHILIGLGGIFQFAFVLFIFPRFLRNFIYDIIARNRYKWFGRKEQCFIPDEKIKERFIIK